MLVREIDQRHVPNESTAVQETHLGQIGVLPPGTHRIAFRLDGFGVAASAIDLYDVQLILVSDTLMPDAFVIPDQQRVFASREVTSLPTMITGLAAPAPVSVTGGTYSVGCNDVFTSQPGLVESGQVVCVRHVSNPEVGGSSRSILTIGGYTETFATITSGPEAALVSSYYRGILQREADLAGQVFWEGEGARMRARGVDINEAWYALAIQFFNSAEYREMGRSNSEFVRDLYVTFFNRFPDAGGNEYWTSQIAAGLSREIAVLAFLFSSEFKSFTNGIFGDNQVRAEVDMVIDFYRGVLGRLPDDIGLSYWLARFRAAQCAGRQAFVDEVEAISAAFATSAEYVNRGRDSSEYVADLYNAFLRRGGELSGFQFWISQLESGARTREGLRREFIASPEFGARVSRALSEICIVQPPSGM